jgi:hypothetical protein
VRYDDIPGLVLALGQPDRLLRLHASFTKQAALGQQPGEERP